MRGMSSRQLRQHLRADRFDAFLEFGEARAEIEDEMLDPGIMEAGDTLEDDIRTHDWGETSFYGIDPWGNKLCFIAAGTEFTGGRFVE